MTQHAAAAAEPLTPQQFLVLSDQEKLRGRNVTVYFSFTAAWNSFLRPWIILMSGQGKWPLSIVLYKRQFF